ncbi:MAG: hypothetical protein M3Z65_01110 [Chloroflexota bacterium]|nr:hypothetical protein [Chloroflexota bacterium]
MTTPTIDPRIRTGSSPEQQYPDGMLWLGVFTGPIVWTADLLLIYGLISIECSKHLRVPDPLYYGPALVAGFLTIGALLSARRLASRALGGDPTSHRRRFMAHAGMLMSAGYLLAVLLLALPLVMLPRCA